MRSELIGNPLVAVVLLLVFGLALAYVLPLAMGLVSITGAIVVLGLPARYFPVNVFALNIITALGFGLAVEYGLIVVSRFREGLDCGLAVPDALWAMVSSEGRAVAVSAAVVVLSLPALLLLSGAVPSVPGGRAWVIAVVCLAGVSVLVLQPALAAVFGHRLRGRRSARLPRRRDDRPEFWDGFRERCCVVRRCRTGALFRHGRTRGPRCVR